VQLILRNSSSYAIVLKIAEVEKKFMISKDVCKRGLGGALMHK